MIPEKDRSQLALEKFIAGQPQLLDEIKDLSAEDQQQQIQWAFDDQAEERGIEPWELALELTATSPEELKALRLEVHHEVAEALGMSWEEYCSFNDIEL